MGKHIALATGATGDGNGYVPHTGQGWIFFGRPTTGPTTRQKSGTCQDEGEGYDLLAAKADVADFHEVEAMMEKIQESTVIDVR